MAEWKPGVFREWIEERNNWKIIFEGIKSGKVDFDDFFHNYLDDIRNEEFDGGYSYALDNVEAYVKESNGDAQYVLFLIQKERNTLNGKADSI